MRIKLVTIAILLTMTQANELPAEPSDNHHRKQRPENHLAGEKSPYLIQHVRNPVDWYPWGKTAFEKAKKENKPILLSIGYSTCHWCHVMERESFENEEIAKFLNKHFVSIKVDREERPDVDKIYMTAYQAMYQAGGGWPLNMFLTPDLKPFAGGTYFPPKDRQGRPGFLRVLKTLADAWKEKGDEVLKSANDIHADMSRILGAPGEDDGELVKEDLDRAAQVLLADADGQHGGWGQGPKFPQVSHLRFLLRFWYRTGDKEVFKHMILTADKMMQGGIHDHLAGGFHRYAVDGHWLVPHFEKMLYDQAQLLEFYLDLWLITKDARYRTVAVGISDYVLREMQHKEGGFYSAQDAQSEGKEGKYHCWTLAELKHVLTDDELRVATRWFGVTEKGNFIDHSDPDPLPDLNVLYLADPNLNISKPTRVLLNSAISKMRAVRAKRVPAATDDKVLADWNGIMIAALARTGRVLDEKRYLDAAVKAHAFVKAKLWDGKLLYHRWRDGERDQSQQASSYLQMTAASLALYQTTLESSYLDFAILLAEGAEKLFYDSKHGGFFVGTDRPDLVLRLKDDFDGATPTASSQGALQFLKLAEMTGREEFRKIAEKSMRSVTAVIKRSPYAMPEMMSVAEMELGDGPRLVLAVHGEAEDFISARYQVYSPHLLLMGNKGKVDAFSKTLKPKDDKTTAYYCVGKTCLPPVTSVKELIQVLEKKK